MQITNKLTVVKVTDTAKHYLPGPAGTAVKLVGDSVGLVAETVKSNIQHATDKVSNTAQITQNIVNDKVLHAQVR